MSEVAIRHDADAGALYIALVTESGKIKETLVGNDTYVLYDLDAEGTIIGIELIDTGILTKRRVATDGRTTG